jgi:hypothetical protein
LKRRDGGNGDKRRENSGLSFHVPTHDFVERRCQFLLSSRVGGRLLWLANVGGLPLVFVFHFKRLSNDRLQSHDAGPRKNNIVR